MSIKKVKSEWSGENEEEGKDHPKEKQEQTCGA
jgi:hypothetical protein